MNKVVAVFGSSAPHPGSTIYQLAYQLGNQLAFSGYTVATGGYQGTMAAVSQGAFAAGGHIIGVTSDQIEKFRPLGPNEWIKEEIRYPSLRERLLHLIEQNDAMITLPGGIGTLSEMSLAWSFLQTGELNKRPLILLGDMWQKTVQSFSNPEFVKAEHIDLIKFAHSPERAVTLLNQFFDE